MLADLFKAFPGFPVLLSGILLLPGATLALPRDRSVQIRLRLIGVAVCTTALVALLLAFANLLVPDYVDNVEPTVVSNAWIWWHGGQLYPRVGPGTELRGLLYGPLTFFLAGVTPMLFWPSVFVTKLPPTCLFLGSIVATWFACRKAGASRLDATLASSAMTVVLGISDAPYWVRGDSVLILIGSLSAWLAARPASHPLGRAILLGLLAGAASALKLHGAAYVAPACLMAMLDATGWRQSLEIVALIGAMALVAFVLPLLPAGVSLDGYAFYLSLAARHGFSPRLFIGNLMLVLGVCLPLFVLSRTTPRLPRRCRLLSIAGLGCALLVAFVAGKPGAGYPHLLPFLPYAALVLLHVLASRETDKAVRLLTVGAIFCVAFCMPVIVRAATFASRSHEFAVIAEGEQQIRHVVQQHPGQAVAVGYGGESFLELRLAYLRVIPVFGGAPLFYDATAMDDLWQGGMDPAIALVQLDHCAVPIWLIPGDEPFTIRNFYGGFTFSEEFRRHFLERYRMEPSTGPFSVWVCRPSPLAETE